MLKLLSEDIAPGTHWTSPDLSLLGCFGLLLLRGSLVTPPLPDFSATIMRQIFWEGLLDASVEQ